LIGRRNIVISGLTAAGKTTHARLLAKSIGYQYLSATQVMVDLLGLDGGIEGLWRRHGETIAAARESGRIDAELDRRLKRVCATKSGLVIDSWALPWTGHKPVISIWLESSLDSRAAKAFVSQGEPRSSNLEECRSHIVEKDNSTRQYFLSRYGFDIFRDRAPFDIILENSHLMTEPSERASRRGIRVFQPILERAVWRHRQGRNETLSSIDRGMKRLGSIRDSRLMNSGMSCRTELNG
jgi:cytidylate kinase